MEEFLFRVKTSTAEVHKQLENSTLSKIIMSPAVTTDLYAEYLSSIYNMHKEVEERVFKVVAPVIKDILNRQKTHKIISDLSQLGKEQPLNTKTFLNKAYTTSLNFNLGIMYVTEGSVLGGQYILKNIKHVLGVKVPGNFFNVYGTQTGASWKNFTIQLNDYQATLNDVGKEEIISGAKYGFERAHSIFN